MSALTVPVFLVGVALDPVPSLMFATELGDRFEIPASVDDVHAAATVLIGPASKWTLTLARAE